MTEKIAIVERVPRFSWIAGVGGIFVYLLSSLPLILIVSALKIASLSASGETLSDSELNDVINDLLKSPWMLVAILLVQSVCLFIYVYFVSLIRGTRNPFQDFGIKFTKSSLYFVLAGVGLQVVGLLIGIPLQLLRDSSAEQGVVTSVRESQGLSFIFLMLMVGLVVPVAEEICFRGLFLRGLSRKVSPAIAILITGVIFAAIHLSDPGAFLGATALLMVGILASALAVYRGRIDASICLHVGFNLTTVFILVFTR